jgi:hypothetical protein
MANHLKACGKEQKSRAKTRMVVKSGKESDVVMLEYCNFYD